MKKQKYESQPGLEGPRKTTCFFGRLALPPAAGGIPQTPSKWDGRRTVVVVRLYSAGPRCQGTNLGQSQSRGSTSSPRQVALAVFTSIRQHDCWRFLTYEERTRPHYKYLALHRTSVPFASLGKTTKRTDSCLNALHMMGRLVISPHLLPDASKYGQCYLAWR